MTLFLFAPSQTIHDVEEIWTGNTDTTLSDVGILDAQYIREPDGIKVDRAYCAPATHIRQFADLVLAKPEYEVLAALTDRSMGTLTGRVYRETMIEFPRRNWLGWHRSYWIAPPEGESFFDITDRIVTAFRTKILPVSDMENVAIFADCDVVRVLIGYLSKMDEGEIPKIRVEPCVPHTINGSFS